MLDFEQRLKPSDGRFPVSRDVALIALLAGLAYLLLPAWARGQGGSPTSIGQWPQAVGVFSKAMLSYYLLPALGFLLAMRRGAIDLSVWMAFSLGSLTAGLGLVKGLPPVAALPAGMLAGIIPGALNGIMVSRLRVPSFVATLVTAGLLVWLLPVVFGSENLRPANDALESLLFRDPTGAGQTGRLAMSRSLLVAAIFALTIVLLPLEDAAEGSKFFGWPLIVLLTVIVGLVLRESGLVVMMAPIAAIALLTRRRPGASGQPGDRSWGVWSSLVASGILSAAGGALSVMDLGHAPVPIHLVGDLRIPAAALLAGAWYLAGDGRMLLSVVLLPLSLLLATAWGQTWDLAYFDYPLQLALLGGLVLVGQLAADRFFRLKLRGVQAPTALIAAISAGLSLLVLSGGVGAADTGSRVAHVLGSVLGALAVLMLVICLLRREC